MAIRTATISPVGVHGMQANTIVWTGLLNTDVGNAVEVAHYQDRSVRVVGTFGVGGVVEIEGSLLAEPSVDADWATLNDPQGNALSMGTTRIESVLEHVRWVRPRVSAGDGTTNLTAYLFIGSGARR